MYDLITHDRRQTQRLLKRLRSELPGSPAESASLPTGELLVLMHEREGSNHSHVAYLLGGSALLPVMELERTADAHAAPLLVPRLAQQLMRGQGGMRMKASARGDLRRTVKQLIS